MLFPEPYSKSTRARQRFSRPFRKFHAQAHDVYAWLQSHVRSNFNYGTADPWTLIENYAATETSLSRYVPYNASLVRQAPQGGGNVAFGESYKFHHERPLSRSLNGSLLSTSLRFKWLRNYSDFGHFNWQPSVPHLSKPRPLPSHLVSCNFRLNHSLGNVLSCFLFECWDPWEPMSWDFVPLHAHLYLLSLLKSCSMSCLLIPQYYNLTGYVIYSPSPGPVIELH